MNSTIEQQLSKLEEKIMKNINNVIDTASKKQKCLEESVLTLKNDNSILKKKCNYLEETIKSILDEIKNKDETKELSNQSGNANNNLSHNNSLKKSVEVNNKNNIYQTKNNISTTNEKSKSSISENKISKSKSESKSFEKVPNYENELGKNISIYSKKVNEEEEDYKVNIIFIL
jgi:hypothetical protein